MVCRICGKKAELIMGACRECDPELHEASDAARDYYNPDFRTTAELKRYRALLQQRRRAVHDNENHTAGE